MKFIYVFDDFMFLLRGKRRLWGNYVCRFNRRVNQQKLKLTVELT